MTPALLEQVIAEARLSRSLPAPELRRALRENAGLSQEQVAFVLGVSRPAVTRWENGLRSPRGSVRVAYAQLLERLTEEIGDQRIVALNDRNPAGSPGLGETISGAGAAGHVGSG